LDIYLGESPFTALPLNRMKIDDKDQDTHGNKVKKFFSPKNKK